MKIVIAPDSFKNALRAPEVAAALRDGLRETLPEAEYLMMPLADGGEGTTEAFCAGAGGTFHEVASFDPLMRPITAKYGVSADGRTAVVELAAASGLELLTDRERSAVRTSTYGTGILLRSAVNHPGVTHLIVGLGGSATTDGGAGMLQALGMRFFDASGRELPPGITGGDLGKIARMEEPVSLGHIVIDAACDVRNPLTGPRGAAAVFAPQKGASEEDVALLDANLKHFAGLWRETAGHPGDGAAGGAGFAMRMLGGTMKSGASLLLAVAGFAQKVQGAALVITGEGRSDAQTAEGKLCMIVAEASHQEQVPCMLLSGCIADAEVLADCFDAVMSISNGPGTVADAIGRTRENLKSAGRAVGALLRAGCAVGNR